MAIDAYEYLGVPFDATDNEIKLAYIRLLNQYNAPVGVPVGGTGLRPNLEETQRWYQLVSTKERREDYNSGLLLSRQETTQIEPAVPTPAAAKLAETHETGSGSKEKRKRTRKRTRQKHKSQGGQNSEGDEEWDADEIDEQPREMASVQPRSETSAPLNGRTSDLVGDARETKVNGVSDDVQPADNAVSAAAPESFNSKKAPATAPTPAPPTHAHINPTAGAAAATASSLISGQLNGTIAHSVPVALAGPTTPQAPTAPQAPAQSQPPVMPQDAAAVPLAAAPAADAPGTADTALENDTSKTESPAQAMARPALHEDGAARPIHAPEATAKENSACKAAGDDSKDSKSSKGEAYLEIGEIWAGFYAGVCSLWSVVWPVVWYIVQSAVRYAVWYLVLGAITAFALAITAYLTLIATTLVSDMLNLYPEDIGDMLIDRLPGSLANRPALVSINLGNHTLPYMARSYCAYSVLGLPYSPGLSAVEVRTAYRRAALLSHPDKSAFTASKAYFDSEGNSLSDVREAYAILSDPYRRCVHDQLLGMAPLWKRKHWPFADLPLLGHNGVAAAVAAMRCRDLLPDDCHQAAVLIHEYDQASAPAKEAGALVVLEDASLAVYEAVGGAVRVIWWCLGGLLYLLGW